MIYSFDKIEKIEFVESNYHNVVYKKLLVNNIEIKQRDKVNCYCQNCNIQISLDKRSIVTFNKFLCSKCRIINLYGVDCVFKSETIKDKIKQIKLKKYGDEYFTNREKYKQTNMEKYGVDHSSKRPEIKEKLKNKVFSKEYKDKISNSLRVAHSDKEKYKDFINKGGKCKWFDFIDKNGTVHKCQGTYELRFAKLLESANIKWSSFHKQLILSNGDRYAPDFIIEDSIYIDTKADYFYNLQKEKIDLAIKEINLKLILTDDLNKIEQDLNVLKEKLYG